MATIRNLQISPPVINTACAWVSELDQLQELFDCPYTGAVTTRTSTLDGFPQTSAQSVAFTKDSLSSLNTYGYSPYPLSTYLQHVQSILTSAPSTSNKPIIISITSLQPPVLSTMLTHIQSLRTKLNDQTRSPSPRIAVELNTSCPNIVGKPPPAYDTDSLRPLLQVFKEHWEKDLTLTIGLKLPPYTYATQFEGLIACVAEFSTSSGQNPIAFFTSTNTLGSSLIYPSQTTTYPSTSDPTPGFKMSHPSLASILSTTPGGLGGESIHALSLGNVFTLTKLLCNHGDVGVRGIVIIGVGGVTSYEAKERMRSAGAVVVGLATLLGREGLRAFEIVSSPPQRS